MLLQVYKTNKVLPMKMHSFTWWPDTYRKQTKFSNENVFLYLMGWQLYKTNKVLPMKMYSFTWWPDTYTKQTMFSQWKCIPLLDGLTTIQNKQSSPNENVFLYLMARHLYKTNNVLPMKMYSFTWWADNYTKQTEFSQWKCIPLLDGQTTPASSLCPQLCTPHTLLGQGSDVSLCSTTMDVIQPDLATTLTEMGICHSLGASPRKKNRVLFKYGSH